jgi:hypothetical protein
MVARPPKSEAIRDEMRELFPPPIRRDDDDDGASTPSSFSSSLSFEFGAALLVLLLLGLRESLEAAAADRDAADDDEVDDACDAAHPFRMGMHEFDAAWAGAEWRWPVPGGEVVGDGAAAAMSSQLVPATAGGASKDRDRA